MKLINPKIHGILDYCVVLFLWLSAPLLAFTPWVVKFTFVLGFVHLLLTVFTDFPVGGFKVLPFRIHGFIELVVAIVLVVSPWFLNLNSVDKVFYVAFGIAVFLTWILTDYDEQNDRSRA